MESKVLFRTFIAIPVEIPSALRETLIHLRKEFSGEQIRWIDPAQMHITLRFLGDIDQAIVETVKARFSAAYEPFERSTCRLHGIGTFSHRSELKVLWAGIPEKDMLKELFAATQGMLEGITIAGDNRMFRPHLTLARMKRLRDVNRFSHQATLFSDRELGAFELGKVVFYRSILKPSGARYEVLEVTELK